MKCVMNGSLQSISRFLPKLLSVLILHCVLRKSFFAVPDAMTTHSRKFTDPVAKSLYTDSLKHNSTGPPHFLLNGIGNGRPGNGFSHANNGHAVTYNNGGGVNLHINPFQDNANKHENVSVSDVAL